MTRVAVISPHLDDGAFSVAEHMLSRPDWEFTIVCPFGGQPTEEPHRSKYIILHDEHQRVCEFAGWDFINGPFFDDAASGRTRPPDPYYLANLDYWLGSTLSDGWDQLWFPAGIHHPDHTDVALNKVVWSGPPPPIWVYEELPYRVLYPRMPAAPSPYFQLQGYDPSHLQTKKELCRMYASQVDDQLERCLYAPERLWGMS